MAWIKTVPTTETEGEAGRVYQEILGRSGRIDNVHQSMSLKPEALRAWFDFSRAVSMGGTSLGRRREELIATVISARLRCTY